MPIFDDDNPAPTAPVAAVTQNQRRVALVIGNGAYAHASPLANPVNDAKAMTRTLAGFGFDVLEGLDLKRDSMEELLFSFDEKVDRADVALLFYAGHGLQVKKRNYLLPIDADVKGEAYLKRRTFSLNEILDIMGQKQRTSIVFLDACRNNPFARQLRELGVRDAGVGGLAAVARIPGSLIAFATEEDNVAQDGKGENSPFTSSLLHHIPISGLSLTDMMIDVRNDVLQETDGAQQPWVQYSLDKRFYFVPEEEKPPVPVSPPVPAKLVEAEAAWKHIENSSHIGQLTIFRDKYEGTVYADYAEHRISEVRAADEKARAQKEVQRLAEERQIAKARAQDDEAFARAQTENTIVAYKSYLSAWRQGVHILEAKAEIKRLKPSLLKPLLAGASVIALLAGSVVVWQNLPERQIVEEEKVTENTQPPVVVSDKLQRLSFEPEVKFVKGGTFSMGCVSGKDCESDEKPVHRVTVGSFYMSKYETSFAQYDACVTDGGCTHKPSDEGWGRGNRPVINVSWSDAVTYAKWLSGKTGQKWRLPTEAEWEYAARAGSDKKYSWGNSVGKNKANCYNCGSQWDSKKTAPVGSFSANRFGLHDMHGNVWEWVHDWKGKYKSGHQIDPKGPKKGSDRVYRGGGWFYFARSLRSANRLHDSPGFRVNNLGFRLLRQP